MRFKVSVAEISSRRSFNAIKKKYAIWLLFLSAGLINYLPSLYGDSALCNGFSSCKQLDFNNQKLTYYLYIEDFAESFIEIPTSNVSGMSTTISSKYLAGRSPIYNEENEKIGICSASFLCMQNSDGIYTDISNFLSVDNGLIVSWFTPTTLINLELDSIIHSMVTECMVVASTKVGFNPFYGQTFDLIVSSDDGKIYFEFVRTGTIF